MVKQGTIIKINFNPQAGHEQAGYRPAVVISNNVFNQKTKLSIKEDIAIDTHVLNAKYRPSNKLRNCTNICTSNN